MLYFQKYIISDNHIKKTRYTNISQSKQIMTKLSCCKMKKIR